MQSLPSEILLQILGNLPAESVVACSATSKQLRRAADQSIWRQRCLDDFGEWDQRHNLPDLLKKSSSEVDWRGLYVSRCGVHRNTQRALDAILSQQLGRLDRVRSVIDYGIDIEDVLIKNINASTKTPDVLARRWYAKAILGRLHRERAIRIWTEVANDGGIKLIKALHAFDVFVRGEQAPSFTNIEAILQRHADRCTSSVRDWDDLSTRDKAITLAQYLLENGLVGLRDEHDFSDVRNSFIGHALTHDEHPSLQLISTAIFCGVAERLGLTAKVCGFPGHVVAIVFAQDGLDIDDRPLGENQSRSRQNDDRLYLDPFQSYHEKPVAELRLSLRQLGITGEDAEKAIGPSSDAEIVLRCGRNIITAVQARHQRGILSNDSGIDSNDALYGALWCFLIVTGAEPDVDSASMLARRRSYLPHFMDRFEHHYPFDAHLLVDLICPLFNTSEERQYLRNKLRDAMGKDSIPPSLKLRADVPAGAVRYRIGQVVQHARYSYRGLIYGWDIECTASETWIQMMDVGSLRRGHQQSFYHIIDNDGSTRYVAEDNIQIIKPVTPPPVILAAAGQWFKRWDSENGVFVSNIRDEYPDD